MADKYKQLASKIFNVPYEQVTKEQREKVKQTAYLHIYAASSRKLSEVLNEPRV